MKWDSLVWIKTIDLVAAINKYIADLKHSNPGKAKELHDQINN